MENNGDITVKDALASASIKLRMVASGNTSVLAPQGSQPITIDPVMAAYFDISSPDSTTADQVKIIDNWLQAQGGKEANIKLDVLRSIEHRLGGADPGTRLERVYRYIQLKSHADNLHLQAKAMEKT